MAGNSSLGTAWIQIKPSLSGITNDLKRELSGVSTESENTLKSSFSSAFQGIGSNIQSTFSTAFSKTADFAKTIFTATFAGITGALTASIGGAISRIDTLNNAPRVFEALGYSSDSVSKSMDTLNGYLDGLPTTLDGAVSSVQMLSSSFGGIENGTRYFQALNNAGLAFGASTDQIQNGITQLSQLSLDGPLDAGTWNSLQNSGFGPVFAAMAEQAGTTVGALKEDFGGNGTKSVKDFMDALIELDENGTGSMASLAELARANTDGIATSFTNAKTAVSRGVASIIESIPNLASSVASAGKSIEGVLKGDLGIDEAASSINEALSGILGGIGDVISKIVPLILETLPGVISTVVDSIVDFISNEENVTQIIDGVVKLFVAVAAGAGKIATAIIPLLPSIIGQIVGSLGEEFAKPENAVPIISGLGILLGATTLKTVGSNLTKNLKQHIGGVFVKFFQKDVGGDVAQKAGSSIKSVATSISSGITAIADTISTTIKGLGTILTSVVSAVMEPLKALLKGVGEALSGFFAALADPMVALGAAIFVVAAAAIAAAIFLIGSAIGAIMPTLITLFNEILMPFAAFMVETVLVLIDAITIQLINFTNSALIPLGTFLLTSFLLTVDSITNAIINLTQNAVIPLINTLSGAFTSVLTTVASLINDTLRTALDGITNIIDKVGEGFTRMGGAIRTALDGANGILSTFADLIASIADAVVAVVALATGQSIDYGYGFAHISKAATGGRVVGFGTDTSDSNLYALSNGEYVIRAAAARQIGYDNLDELNKTGGLDGRTVNCSININGYNKDPEELATIISRKIALREQGVY